MMLPSEDTHAEPGVRQKRTAAKRKREEEEKTMKEGGMLPPCQSGTEGESDRPQWGPSAAC